MQDAVPLRRVTSAARTDTADTHVPLPQTPQTSLKPEVPWQQPQQPVAGPSVSDPNIVRTVRSPSIHRDYGHSRKKSAPEIIQKSAGAGASEGTQPLLSQVEPPMSASPTKERPDSPFDEKEDNDELRVSIHAASPHSLPALLPVLPLQTDDEFRLSPLSPAVSPLTPSDDDRFRLSRMPTISEEGSVSVVERSMSQDSSSSMFKAFTWKWKWFNPWWFALVECAITVILVIAALVLNIIQSV
jgi:hypothetical protein